MKLKRTMIVRHPRGEKKLAIHELINGYHYERIDDDHVLVVGGYPAVNHSTIDTHRDCLLLPSVLSPKCVHKHAEEKKKVSFKKALHAMGVKEGTSTGDVLEMAHHLYGEKFALKS